MFLQMVEETNHWPFNNNQCLSPPPSTTPPFSLCIIWWAVCVCVCVYGMVCGVSRCTLWAVFFFLWGSLWLTPRPLFLWGQPAKNQATYQRVGGAQPGHWVSGKIISINKYHKTPLEGKALMWGGWAPLSLFSLTLLQPQYRLFSSGVFSHRQTFTTCSDKMAHVCSSILISAAPNVQGLVVSLSEEVRVGEQQFSYQ